jgi:hypothetical protein
MDLVSNGASGKQEQYNENDVPVELVQTVVTRIIVKNQKGVPKHGQEGRQDNLWDTKP